MRPLLSFFLALAVAFWAAGEGGVGVCACGCGEIEEICPCGHPGSNDTGGSFAPSIPECITNAQGSSYTAVCSSVIQIEHKANTASDTGKLSAHVSVFSEYPAYQPPIALRVDLLHGPPKLNGFEKTNTRLASLSTLRI
jgi:hypothetical protein